MTHSHRLATASRRALAALALCGALLPASSLLADEPAPPVNPSAQLPAGTQSTLEGAQDDLLSSLKVTRVQPVIFTSSDEIASVRAVLSANARAAHGADQKIRVSELPPTITVPKRGKKGFSFAGASSELDIVSLKYGFMLASLPLLQQASSPEDYEGMLNQLDQLAAIDEVYAAPLAEHIKAYVAAAKAGTMDMEHYMGMLTSATQGMASATDPAIERMHGYLMLGLWSGLVVMAAEADQLAPSLKSQGEALTLLLEKDATYGGSDSLLATQVKLITAELGKPSPTRSTLSSAVREILQVQPDKKKKKK